MIPNIFRRDRAEMPAASLSSSLTAAFVAAGATLRYTHRLRRRVVRVGRGRCAGDPRAADCRVGAGVHTALLLPKAQLPQLRLSLKEPLTQPLVLLLVATRDPCDGLRHRHEVVPCPPLATLPVYSALLTTPATTPTPIVLLVRGGREPAE